MSRRHGVVALSFLAWFVAYTDRVNISVAAVGMQEQLGWTPSEKGLVLSSFFVGYMLFMVAGGWFARRYGGYRVLGLAVLAWTVFTLLTPLAASTSLGVLLAARIGMGLGEAAVYPATIELYTRWVPATERARAVARMLSGIPLGTVVGLLATGWLLGRYPWSAAFYSFGALGIVWVALWFTQASNDPATDRRVGAEERALLAKAAEPAGSATKAPTMGQLLRHPPVWAMFLGHFAANWTLYVLLTWLPSYFRDVQHSSIAGAGVLSAAPWLAMFASANVAGVLSDRMIRRGVSVTFTRKLMQLIGLLGPAVFLVALRDVHSPTVALVLLCGATASNGFTWSGFAPNSLDLSPQHASVITGMSNTFATIPGIVGVAVTGWLVQVTHSYTSAFVLAGAVSVVGALAYAVLFDARPVAISGS
jgi:ACS family sodium-dependent inorganic phosphate cotransporter